MPARSACEPEAGLRRPAARLPARFMRRPQPRLVQPLRRPPALHFREMLARDHQGRCPAAGCSAFAGPHVHAGPRAGAAAQVRLRGLGDWRRRLRRVPAQETGIAAACGGHGRSGSRAAGGSQRLEFARPAARRSDAGLHGVPLRPRLQPGPDPHRLRGCRQRSRSSCPRLHGRAGRGVRRRPVPARNGRRPRPDRA